MANPSKLIADPRERTARAKEKTRLILRFLRDECWTTTEIAARVMGVKYPAAHRTLNQMQRDRFLKSEELILYSRTNGNGGDPDGEPTRRRFVGRKIVLWGITPHGLAFAWDLEEEWQIRAAFELGKLNPSYVEHHIGVQRLRLQAQAAGWELWTPGRLLLGRKLAKVPDSEATDPSGTRVAVEFEREIKTAKRYAGIVGAYLVALKAERWQRVDYVCPTVDMAARLKRAIYGLKEITYQGRKAKLIHEQHLDNRITFSGVEQWPLIRTV